MIPWPAATAWHAAAPLLGPATTDVQALGSPPPKPEGVEEDPRDDGVGTAEHSYWLAPGCVRMLPRHGDSYSPVGFFELGSRAVGKVQCCSNGTSATYCTRAVQKAPPDPARPDHRLDMTLDFGQIRSRSGIGVAVRWGLGGRGDALWRPAAARARLAMRPDDVRL